MPESKRILVIEDDRLTSRLVSATLVKAGYEVMAVPDGMTGLEIIEIHHPDLILLDMYLPTLNGWGFLEKYAQLPEHTAPVIALSATQVDIPGSVAGFLLKPFSPSKLLDEISRILGGSAA